MVLPELSWNDGFVLAVTLAVLFLPGLGAALALGLRGWTLAASAPLVSVAIIGLAGPWTSAIGVRWTVLPVLLVTLLVAAIGLALRRWAGPREEARSPWTAPATVAVAVCACGAAAVGLVAVVVGLGRLSAIPQGWDAAFHANGIRHIADTGDGGLNGMTLVNQYESGHGYYYPNAYHLAGALVRELTGRDIPAILNADTAFLPGLLALGLVALVHHYGGRAVLAGLSALVIAAASSFYDLLAAGPLLPYAMGISLLPVMIVLAMRFLDAQGTRERVPAGALTVLGAAGLLCVHPGILITAVVFALPALAARWWGAPSTVRSELLLLLVAGLGLGVLTVTELLGSLQSAASTSFTYPADVTQTDALGQILLFGHNAAFPQWWLAAALAVGLLTIRRLGDLRWLGASALIFAGLFFLVASFSSPWVVALTRPWWNDRFRLIGVAVVPLCLIAAHGLAELQRLVVLGAARLSTGPLRRPEARTTVALASGVVIAALFVVMSGGLYLARNEARLAQSTGEPRTVSAAEVEGFRVLGSLVRPGERVMNDRGDGTVWMYALEGVRPVAGHYDGTNIGPDAALLAARFNQYDTDPQVRDAAARLDVRWAAVGRGFVTSRVITIDREPGLVGLDRVRALRPMYANSDISIYRLDAAPEATP